MTTTFKNKGVIDPRSITTFGVSSKEGTNPIGFFGTGLKYAIAILLREGCEITIYSGLKKMDFAIKKSKIRVDTFDIVTMNKKPLGFTTELGKTWDIWQAVRELYCNCTDEQGTISTNEEPEIGHTTIIVKGQKVKQVMDNLGTIILQSTPLYKLENIEIHGGQSKYVFYNGVRIYELPRTSMYTYNIVNKQLDITEDRTLKYYWHAEQTISRAIAKATFFLKEILTARNNWYENTFVFETCYTFSEEFLDGVTMLRKNFTKDLNQSAIKVLETKRPQSIIDPEPLELTKLESRRVEKAIEFLCSLDIDVREYPIVVTEFLGEGILGQAKNEKIFISRLPLNQGTKILAGTIMEEYFHLKYGIVDCTYGMQNFLVDKIMTIGELLTGEPL